jgi:hypothetical protein
MTVIMCRSRELFHLAAEVSDAFVVYLPSSV